ncbi:UNVERIFIED_CONTAM: hypothetical protein FKN15_026280 [Acipenser sinensis]
MRAHHRPSVWWEEVVLHESFSAEQWIETFRVIRTAFDQLVELVLVDMEPSPIHVRTPVPLQKRVGIALYKLLGQLIRQDSAQQNGFPPQRELRTTFDQLVELVLVDMEPSPIHVRTPVPLQKRVGIALYKLLGQLIRQDSAQQNGFPPQRELR